MTETKQQHFKTIGDVIDHPLFQDYVQRIIYDLVKQRLNRPDPKPGYRYKRDWYDRMYEKEMLSQNYFIEQIGLIWTRQSSLSSEIRNVIETVCTQAYHKTLEELDKTHEKELESN